MNKRNIKIILLAISCVAIMQGCKYEKLPPKTDDASSNYILPKGERPTAEELEEQQAAKDEYNSSIGR